MRHNVIANNNFLGDQNLVGSCVVSMGMGLHWRNLSRNNMVLSRFVCSYKQVHRVGNWIYVPIGNELIIVGRNNKILLLVGKS